MDADPAFPENWNRDPDSKAQYAAFCKKCESVFGFYTIFKTTNFKLLNLKDI